MLLSRQKDNMKTSAYYIDESGKKIYLPNDVEIHFIKGNGGEFKIKATGDIIRTLTIEDTRNRMTINPVSEKIIQLM